MNEDNKELPSIEIYNSDDVTEVAIKTKTKIGQIFMKGRKELISIIGVENLNMKDRDGNLITDLQKISKGKRKYKADKIIDQYCDIQKRPDLKQYSIQITDIYDIPMINEIINNKGKKGFYKDRVIPLIVKYLLLQGNINTTINQLSKNIGLISKSFKNNEIENELIKNNKDITIFEINKFYSYCKPEQERIIFTALDALQDDYSVITYIKNFLILDINGNARTSTLKEDKTIRDVQEDVLEEFGVTRIFSIYQRGKRAIINFYNRVCEILNNKYSFNCKGYYNQIQIYANIERLKKLDSKFSINHKQSELIKNEIHQHFLLRIKEKIKSDYEYNQQLADKKDAENQKKWEKNTEYKNNIPDDIQELLDIGTYDESYVKLKVLQKPKPAYRYHENYIEIMNFLCDYFLI